MLIVSFATAKTPYVEVINQFLIPSLKALSIPYDIAYPEDRGNWISNTQIKPIIIRDMLLHHMQPIVFLDADATVEYYPKLFDELQDYDIAVHYLDWNKFWNNIEGNIKREIAGGTLYFNYNDRVINFLNEWIALTKNDYNDQQTLNKLLPQMTHLKIYNLPIQYCAICKGNNKVPDWIKDPCISHHQISRKYRGYRKN